LHSEGLVRHFAAGEIVQDATSRKAEG
jgi:hypothetical protein